jgi:hypothetical protein
VSTRTQVGIYCDTTGCDEAYYASTTDRGGMNLTFAIYLARRDGWSISKGGRIAHCPSHRRKVSNVQTR